MTETTKAPESPLGGNWHLLKPGRGDTAWDMETNVLTFYGNVSTIPSLPEGARLTKYANVAYDLAYALSDEAHRLRQVANDLLHEASR